MVFFTPIVGRLRAAGYDVHALSLTGLNGPNTPLTAAINLETHISDVVSHIELEHLNDVVLCGHSYGGMVIAGASDRLPGRIRTLLFVDALVPDDGDSVWSIWAPAVRDMFIGASHDGLVTGPPYGVDPRARAHPLASFIQPVRFHGSPYDVSRKVYALCAADAAGPFVPIHDRVASQPGWTTHKLKCGHDIMNQEPEVLLEVILNESSR